METILIQLYQGTGPRASFGEEPWATRLQAAMDELIQMFERENIQVVVVGKETNGYWRSWAAVIKRAFQWTIGGKTRVVGLVWPGEVRQNIKTTKLIPLVYPIPLAKT